MVALAEVQVRSKRRRWLYRNSNRIVPQNLSVKSRACDLRLIWSYVVTVPFFILIAPIAY